MPEADDQADAGTSDPDNVTFARLEYMAKRRLDRVQIEQAILDHLFPRSRIRAMPRDEWEAEVRLALAIQNAASALVETAPRATLDNLIDQDARTEAARQLQSPSGTLVLIAHGLQVVLRAMFSDMIPDSVTIMAHGEHGVKDDSATALFVGHRALLEGKSVLFSPEGGYGKKTGVITVLGARRRVADGAPFLAHATGCNTAWLSFDRGPAGFAPVVVEGPRRDGKEPFDAFRRRFFDFCVAQLERMFTGEPRNILPVHPWKQLFANLGAGTAREGAG